MDRNIIVAADVANHPDHVRAAARARLEAAAEADPALGSVRADTADALLDAVAGPAEQAADSYFDRVLRCLPIEVIAGYVVLASGAAAAFDGSLLRWWLGVLFVLGLLAAPAAAVWLHAVRRAVQVLLTCLAFAVFVAATGGWFATWSWWSSFYALFAAVVFGVAVALLPLGPLPGPGARSRPRPLPAWLTSGWPRRRPAAGTPAAPVATPPEHPSEPPPGGASEETFERTSELDRPAAPPAPPAGLVPPARSGSPAYEPEPPRH